MPGSVVSVDVKEGTTIKIGQQLMVIEAMKMESVVLAEVDGIIQKISVKKGTILFEQDTLFIVEKAATTTDKNNTSSFCCRKLQITDQHHKVFNIRLS